MKSLLPFALDYASRYNWAVHPVNIKKRPVTENGFYDATTDEAQIREYFKNGAQLSVRTGATSGLFVLDLDEDPDKGYSVERTLATLIERYGPLPHTPHQRTGRRGLQYFFKHQEGLRNSAGSLLGPGLDTRGEGGYVVVAPSHNTKGPYEWIVSPDEAPLADVPQWLADLMTAKPERPAPRSSTPTGRNLDPYIDRAFRDEIANVVTAPDGTKHDTLRNAAIKLGTLIAHGLDEQAIEDALYNAISGRADDPDNALRAIRDGIAYGKARPRTIPERQQLPEAEPIFDAHGYACCPNCDRRLKRAKKGNGWYCPRKGEDLCFWWTGDDYTPPAKPQKPTNDTAAAGGPTSQQIIARLAELGYSFRLNDCDNTVEVNGQQIDDITRAQLRMEARDHHIEPLAALEDAYVTEAARHRYHPVKDYLNGLAWDGADHIAALAGYITCPDPPIVYDDGLAAPLHYVYFKRWLIGAVAKVIEQAQNPMLVTVGAQDIGKSALARWFCSGIPDRFLEDPIRTEDKDSSIRLMANFVWEVAELDATTRRSDVSALKAFITKGKVTVRKSYGHHDTIKPAMASMIGTVNDGVGFLSDETGSRRFLVFRVTAIDWAYSKNVDVNQLWAQAVALYRAGEPWRLLPCEATARNKQNEQFAVDDLLDGWLDKYYIFDADLSCAVSTADVAQHLTGHDIRMNGSTEAQAQAIGRAMRRRNVPWRHTRRGRRYYGVLQRCCAPPAASDDDDSKPFTQPFTQPFTADTPQHNGEGEECEGCEGKNPMGIPGKSITAPGIRAPEPGASVPGDDVSKGTISIGQTLHTLHTLHTPQQRASDSGEGLCEGSREGFADVAAGITERLRTIPRAPINVNSRPATERQQEEAEAAALAAQYPDDGYQEAA